MNLGLNKGDSDKVTKLQFERKTRHLRDTHIIENQLEKKNRVEKGITKKAIFLKRKNKNGVK